MSTSMSGGPSRAGDKKRSKNRFNFTASAFVMPKEKQTAEFAASRGPGSRCRYDDRTR